MRKTGMPAAHVSHPNVTPLIDIVMCLIIFYMLVAKIGIDTGADASIKLPESLIGTRITDPSNMIVLNVKPTGGQFAEVSMLNPKSQRSEIFSMQPEKSGQSSYIRSDLKTVLLMVRGKNEEFKIVIRADATLPYRYLEQVLLLAAEVKPKEYNFEAKRPV